MKNNNQSSPELVSEDVAVSMINNGSLCTDFEEAQKLIDAATNRTYKELPKKLSVKPSKKLSVKPSKKRLGSGLPGRPRVIIPNGTRFGRGVVQYFFMREQPDGKTDKLYQLLCDCGNLYSTSGHSLRRGHTKSCGCLNNEKRAINWKKRDEKTLSANRDMKTGQYRPATDPQRLTTPPPRDLTTGKFTPDISNWVSK